ncbi:MAG: citramalate synthase [Anaerolineae bacterium]|nr:citramalate synthase [Anaerolineae bacterium]
MGGERIWVYDTTLRDGTQAEGISLSLEDKVKIAQLLDELGVDYIEGGWPGSNPKDAAFFERAQQLDLRHARITAFGSTCRVGKQPEEDANIQAMLAAGTDVIALVGKSWRLHVEDVLRTNLEENLRIIRDSTAYLKQHGKEVIYDAEHFFDGYKADPDYAFATLEAAAGSGADLLCLCDTNGGAMPWEIETIFGEVQSRLATAGFPQVVLGIHAHNDGGLAVANSLAAVKSGAVHVQGTVNGYGERCGNANLCTIIPNLELKMGLQALPDGQLKTLTRVARAVTSVANQPPDRHAPFVGLSAFAHKGGIHVAAMRRNVLSYQHIDPEAVGNESRVVISELAGRGNLMSMADEMGLRHEDLPDLSGVLEKIKELEYRGFTFEGAEASVEMMLHRSRKDYEPPFELIDFMTVVEHRAGRGLLAEATVKIRIGDQVVHTAAEGNGPVNAMDLALRKALVPVFPHLADFELADYKVHILDSDAGTAATTRVLIDVQNGTRRWSTVGASANIIEASWIALADAVEYGLTIEN